MIAKLLAGSIGVSGADLGSLKDFFKEHQPFISHSNIPVGTQSCWRKECLSETETLSCPLLYTLDESDNMCW